MRRRGGESDFFTLLKASAQLAISAFYYLQFNGQSEIRDKRGTTRPIFLRSPYLGTMYPLVEKGD